MTPFMPWLMNYFMMFPVSQPLLQMLNTMPTPRTYCTTNCIWKRLLVYFIEEIQIKGLFKIYFIFKVGSLIWVIYYGKIRYLIFSFIYISEILEQCSPVGYLGVIRQVRRQKVKGSGASISIFPCELKDTEGSRGKTQKQKRQNFS